MPALLEDHDIFSIVVSDYLDTKDLVTLDTAIASPDDRPAFLDLLRSLTYKPPFIDALEKWWRSNKNCMTWLLRREMFHPEGDFWHVNKKLWSVIVEDTEIDYKPLIGVMKDIFFEGFGAPYDLNGLQYCSSLERLQLCNYNQPVVHASPPNIPNLRELTLQNSKVCNETLRNFMNVTSLSHLILRHVTFETLSEDVLNYYLDHLHTVKVLNRVDEFIKHFCKRPNRFQALYVDMLHVTQATEFSLEQLLVNSPALRELHIERMCVDVQTIFQLIATHCPNLEYLHLNHIRLAVDGSSKGKTFTGEVPFTHLKISTLLPSSDANYLMIVGMTSGKIRHFHVSYAERLTDGGYIQLRDMMPNLHIVEIEDKREVLDGEGERSGRYLRLIDVFRSRVPKLRIKLWESWKAESLKTKYASHGKQVYCQGQGW